MFSVRHHNTIYRYTTFFVVVKKEEPVSDGRFQRTLFRNVPVGREQVQDPLPLAGRAGIEVALGRQQLY